MQQYAAASGHNGGVSLVVLATVDFVVSVATALCVAAVIVITASVASLGSCCSSCCGC